MSSQFFSSKVVISVILGVINDFSFYSFRMTSCSEGEVLHESKRETDILLDSYYNAIKKSGCCPCLNSKVANSYCKAPFIHHIL